ncbi:bifunctional 4-hydroxy-2-oxoglutarate aldolase/2-dehydro-3-deoxy-phosphogluconate aldolase [Halobacillus rhizosphaerae]|uniref:bifunctional 4-hydroxy-2-oxoglutarate aldolase/2-dehydro-3-deoxy-phosphogluconate aldolase n=1 Tax=Halobacillus rhizosphaerae TaxID=3064889 RepID=UPI00398B9038
MNKAMKLNRLEEGGVIAVIRKIRKEDVVPLADALVEGGVTTLEITVDSEQAYLMIEQVKERLGSKALVGAGTVLDGVTARMALQAGADFIFSPNYNKELIQVTNRYGAISIPGVMTPSEMVDAYQEGADAVKIFPASVLGPGYIKDLQGPLGQIPMIPTGGVSIENAGDYITNGAVAVGAGGSLVDKELIRNQDFDGITQLARQFTQAVQQARGEK